MGGGVWMIQELAQFCWVGIMGLVSSSYDIIRL